MAAAFGDAVHHPGRISHGECAGGEIIQEEQRFGALNDQIVHAHGHQVDADRVVHAAFDCHHQLGADAIGGGHQNRIGIAGRAQVEQRAESAKAAKYAGPDRRSGSRFDGVDQRVARLDIHPGLAVGDHGSVSTMFGYQRDRLCR